MSQQNEGQSCSSRKANGSQSEAHETEYAYGPEAPIQPEYTIDSEACWPQTFGWLKRNPRQSCSTLYVY